MRIIATAIWTFATLTLWVHAHANPNLPNVVHGQVTFANPDPHTLSIENSPGAIINWQSFGIAANEITQFIQQGSSSAVLNRVVGADPSALMGSLTSNGQVYLINPNGIVVGHNALIDTAGFVASTLDMTDEDFKRGQLHFEDSGAAGSITNKGFIKAGSGGNILLVAPSITNEGAISTDGGNLILAAGHSVTITSLDDSALQFEIQAPDNAVINIGEMVVGQGAASIFAGTIQHQGAISANSLSVDSEGRVQLIATNDISVTDTAVVDASGVGGGTVHIESISGDTVIEGDVLATGDEQGGAIRLLGDRVGLFKDAAVDASGKQGGGEVLIGGDFQGANPNIKNATQTVIGDKASIKANAIVSGDGGKVIVWSDEHAAFSGRAEAQAGDEGGDGGFIEISGKETLAYSGDVSASSSNGAAGRVLFDPKNIDINDAGGASISNNDEFSENPGQSVQFDPSDIVGILSGGSNVTLQANNDITVTSNVTGDTVGADNFLLTLQAGRTVDIDANISLGFADLSIIANDPNAIALNRDPGAGSIFLRQDRTLDSGPGFGTISLAVSTGVTVGDISLEQGAVIAPFESFADLSVAAGGSIILAPAGGSAAAQINTAGGNIMLTADTIDLQGVGTQLDAASGTGFVGTVTLRPTSAQDIEIVSSTLGTAGVLELETGDLQNINLDGFADGFLVIGSGNTVDITIVDAFTPAGGGNIKDRVSFVGAGDLTINAALDGTGLTGADNGHSLETTVDGDININASVNTGAANGLFLFGQDGSGGTVSINNSAITSPSLTLTGGAGVDAIVGSSLADIYTVTGANNGSFDNANTSVIQFTSIENLNAGGGDDQFVFQTGGSLSGFVDGGAGTDHLDFSALATAINATIANVGGTDGVDVNAATVAGGVTNINQITSGSATTDSLTGLNGANNWAITPGLSTAVYQSGLGILNVDGFETFVGGSAIDTFIIGGADGAVLQSLDGAGGSDTAQFSGNIISVAQSFSNVETMSIVGSDVTVDTALSLDTLTMLAGSLAGSAGGDINITTGFNITAFGSPTTISTTRTIQLLGGSTSSFLVDATGAINFTGSGSLVNNGTINLNIGVGDGTASFANTYNFSNPGSLTVHDGTLAFGGAFVNAGSMLLNQASASLTTVGSFTNNGFFGGLGTVTATAGLVNNAIIDPGVAAIGQLNVVGDVAFASGSTLNVEITSGLSSDVLNVTGNVALNTGAILDVAAIGGYTGGGGGDSFTGVITASGTLGGTSGQFDTVMQPLGFSVTDVYTAGPAGDLTLTSSAIAFNQWIGGAAGDWDIAANWSLGLPGAADDVLIDTVGAVVTHDSGTDTISTLSAIAGVILDITGGVLNISSASTIDGDINIAGGTLNANAAVIQNGDFSWTTGNLSATGGMTLAGVSTISGGTKTLSSSTLVHTNASGSSVLSTSQLNLDASTFLNTGSLDVDTSGGDVLIDQDFTGPGVFENQGTITKIGAGRMDFFNAATLTFNNSGTLDIQAGDIFLRNTSSILNGTLNGAGRLIWDSGSAQVNLSINAPSVFEISSGTHTLTANSVVSGAGSLEWLSGSIASSNLDFTVNSPFVTSTSELRLSSTDLIHTNNVGSSILATSQFNLDNSTFQNNAGALLIVSTPLVADTVLIDQDFTAPGTFTNDGTLTKTGAGSLEFFNAATLTFINTGALDIQAGDILINNTSTQLSGAISGAGKLIWESGSLEGTINLAAPTTFEVTGGTHTLTANTTINGPGLFHWDSGSIASGTLDLIVNAPMTTSTSELRLSSTDIFHNDNSGTSILATSQLNLDASEFTNSVGSILQISTPLVADTVLIDQDFTAAGAFRNFGTLNKTGLGRLEFFNAATLTFENTGTLDIQAGDVFVRNTATILNGTLMGSGPLIWDSGSLEASLNIAAGSELEISGGTHTLSADSILSGAGTVRWLSGTIQSNDLTVNTELFITGASEKRYSSGTFIHTNTGGSSTLDSTGTLNLDNTEFRNTGILIVDAPGTVFIDQDFTAGSLFNNQGTLIKTGAGQFNVFSTATLTFENSGILDVQAGEIFIDNTSILNGSLTGAGKIVWNNGSSSGNLSIASGSLFEISGGTHSYSSASNYSGAGTVQWLSGTINGADLTIDTIFEVTGSSGKRQSGMTITHTNSGGLSFLDSTGTWDLDGATFNNTGTFNIDSTAGTVFIDQDFVAGSFFNNQGTLNKIGAGIFEVFSGGTITFDNTGTLNVLNGEVAVNQPFTNNGLIDLSASGILSGGNATFNNGATGTIQGIGTIVTPAAGLGNSGVLSPGNGSLGTLNVTGNLNFNSGGSYDVQLGPGLVSDSIVVSGDVNINAGSVLDVTTTGGYAGNLADTFSGAITAGGSLNGAFPTVNQPGFTVNPNYTIGPAGDMTLVVGGVFNNWTGAVNNDWNTAGNWTLGIVPDGSHDVRINTVGQIINVGGAGTTIVNTLGVVAGSAVQFTGSNLQLNANSTVNGDLQIGSTLTGGGDIISNGTFDLTSGALNGGGDIFINNLFNINNPGSAVNIGQVVHINSGGTAVWQAGGQNVNNTAGGSILVHSGGSFDAQATNTMTAPITIDVGGSLQKTSTIGISTFSGTVVNNGAIDVQNGTLQITGGFTDNGTIDIANGGTFAVPAGFTQNGSVTDIATGGTLDVGINSIDLTAGGVLSGNGTVNGDVNNISGVLSAGASPGAMLINGNYSQGPGATLLVEVQNPGSVQGVDYDHVTITGTAILDGTLQMVLLGGFVPVEGQLFDVLNYASASGSFSNIPDVDLLPGTQAFSGIDQGSFFQLSAGTAVIPIVPVPTEAPMVPTDGFEEPDLSEVIALEENVGFLETELEEEEDDDETEYKVCSG